MAAEERLAHLIDAEGVQQVRFSRNEDGDVANLDPFTVAADRAAVLDFGDHFHVLSNGQSLTINSCQSWDAS